MQRLHDLRLPFRENYGSVPLLWADSDPVLPLDPVGYGVQRLIPAIDKLTVIEDAGHFLQEDRGERIGGIIADWLSG